MTGFDTILVVDWSGGNDRGPTPKADAIWAGIARGPGRAETLYMRNRQVAEAWLTDFLNAETAAGRRTFAGFDFPFGYPAGFAGTITGTDDPLALWDWIESRIEDAPAANNRFDLAASLNGFFEAPGPFWGNGLKRDIPGLARTKPDFGRLAQSEWRQAERVAKGAFSCWQLSGAGSVGSQVLTGLPVLARLRCACAARAWPFEPIDDAPVALVEVWPSLLRDLVAADPAPIRDEAQVRLLAQAIAALEADTLADMLAVDAPEEGWIFGLGREADLRAAAAMPPPLRNDCFALPPGVDWTPVDVALDRLRGSLGPVTAIETVPVSGAGGRILAAEATALRDNPPGANTAVDGWGFAHAALPGAENGAPLEVPVVDGRAAPGAPHGAAVPPGHALRVLTGALLPEGIDTVVLDEDTRVLGDRISMARAPRRGANTRKAGEDKARGDALLPAGRRLSPPDLALLAATGHASVRVRRRLRVAVLSTGSELSDPGASAAASVTYDANRPMLLALADRWGHHPVDLGRVPDSRADLRAAFERGAREADVIVTSGGASAGDEDHVSALLGEAGTRATWRIALKPGRPLALGFWRGAPVFGLPGNPVAAFVCALIFARPALSVLAGGEWTAPQAFTVPAAFSKSKKPGRMEYLRARLTAEGTAEVFASEGSGRVSGLSWAEGLVELPHAAAEIVPGSPVRFLPYGSFGL